MGFQSGAAENRLDGKPLHSFTVFGSSSDAWVWMNPETFDGREVRVVLVHLKDQFDNLQKSF